MSRGNRNLANYLEGSYTNRYTILIFPLVGLGDHSIKALHWNRTNMAISEV